MAYELDEAAKKVKAQWENEKLTKEQIEYNRKNVGETEAERKNYDSKYGDWSVKPTFKLEDGKVKVSGSSGYLKSDIVKQAKNTISDYFKGYDLSNKQVAEALGKTLNETNKQIDSYLNYQEYSKFLKDTGFSDDAYRNYALAAQEADPKNSTNIMNSKKKITGYGKNGKKLTLTPAEWLDYYKKNWNPEDRAQLWMDGAEALARASSGKGKDDDLYKALPYILMGSKETQNIPAQVLNQLNPFDEGGMDWAKDAENAKTMVPVYGFEDTDETSVLAQTFLRQLAMRGLEISSDVVDMTKNPWFDLGAQSGAQFFGIDDFENSDLKDLSEEDYQFYAEWAARLKEMYPDVSTNGVIDYKKVLNNYLLPDYYGTNPEDSDEKKQWAENKAKEDAKMLALVDYFARSGKAVDDIREREEFNGPWKVTTKAGDYTGFGAYNNFREKVKNFDEGAAGGYEKWVQSNVDDMNKYIQRMSVYAPNAASAGMVAGTIATFALEQLALGWLTGGALTATNIADRLTRAGYRFASGLGKTEASIRLGQQILAKSPKVAEVLKALAEGGKKGWEAAKGLDAVSKIIYVTGEIGTWAVKELGEDVIRGLVDDTIMKKSFDSQGNLDPNKLVENIYMNALMAGIGHGAKGALKGLASIVDNASTRNIDGVELNASQRHQLDLFQKALDDQNRRIQFKGWNEDGNPVISLYGKTKILDQLSPSEKTMATIDEATGAVMPTASRTIEEIMSDEEVSDGVKQKISEAVEEQRADNGDIKTKIEEKLTDDEIREAFPDGIVKVGDQTIKVDTKEFTAGDVGRTTGKEFSNMDEAITGLKSATKTSDFASGVRGILRHSVQVAKEFKQAIQDFADANNMTVRDVMIAIRESRLSGQEKIPGLQELWDNSWKPLQEKLLDLQEALTGIRPTEHNFYFRDMLEGTFKLGDDGKFSINLDSVEDALGGEASFDLSASSTAHNSGKLGDIAADRLEYDPEVLMREFVASRMQTIWQTNDMGKVFATMEEAHAAGEFNFTEADAKKSVDTTKQVATDVESSEGVQAVQEMTNVSELDDDFGSSATSEIDSEIEATKARIAELEKQSEQTVVAKTVTNQADAEVLIKDLASRNDSDMAKRITSGEKPDEIVSDKLRSGINSINKKFHAGEALTDDEAKNADFVDSLFVERTTGPKTLYRYQPRGTSGRLKKGKTITPNFWQFTSENIDRATTYKNISRGGVMYKYNIPENSPILDMTGFRQAADPENYTNWNEILLPRGTEYRITNVTRPDVKGKIQGNYTEVELTPVVETSRPEEASTKVELAAEKVRLKDLEARRRAVLNAETFSDDEAKIDDEISTLNKDIDRMKAEIKDRQTLQYKKQTVQDFHKLDYETRKQMVKDFVRHNPEYVVAYRNQNTGVDDWYSNGSGVHGDNKTFDSYGSDKGDLKDAVWLTTDEEWAEGKERASAQAYNGAPEQTVVIPIKRSLIVDGGGEQPSYDPKLGEADMAYFDNPYYSLKRFSELNGNKIVQTRATQLEDEWIAAKDENGGVTDAMRYRLNPEFYNRTELVLFKDQLPNVKTDGEKAVVDFANENAKTRAEIEMNGRVNQRAIRDLETDIKTTEDYIKGLQEQKAAIKNEAPAKPDTSDEATQKTELKQEVESNKKEILDTQKKFNASAKKSNAAELISRNSGYSNRAQRVDARAPIGVNFLPGNPFGKFFSWVNDHFTKANSIKVEFSGYKADGSPTTMAITAYNGGYKMYAEAGSFARNVIVDIQNGESLWDAIYKQVYDNGFFIEPSKSQIKKYGALRVQDQAAKVTDKIMDRITADQRFSHVFNDDGTVKSTDGLLAILTTRFMGQGISDFTKFLRKANWDSFTKGQKDWLNARMYEMTASVNKSTARKVIEGLMRASMALRYRSNMYWNFKNGQLQLTECQRLFTMNKLGDFSATLKRLVTDEEYRQKASDYTYILAADSAGAGLSKSELDSSTDAFVKVGAASVFSKEGVLTNIDTVKAKFGEIDDAALASIHGGEYAKNFILIAGFLAAGERQGLSGAELDVYVRNRFNVEALAGTKVGKIGLTDSRIGQFTFMYLGFPIRDLTLQVHTIRGGGTMGGKGWKRFVGAADYLGKMLGAKGLMWAVEAPWGYSLMDQLNIDPFGVMEQYDPINTPYEEREPGWRVVDYLVKYNPLLQGAMTNTAADIYMKYRAAEEEARANYKEQHDGSTEGFQWSIFQDGAENFNDIMSGLEPIGNAALGYIPGYTSYSRAIGEIGDLDRGYHLSQSGNRMYETNTDLGNALWGAFTGRKNTANAQAYYQTSNPIRGLIDNGLPGLGQQLERALPIKFDSLLAGKNPFRRFREFDPVDSETYDDWFDGSYQDQQNWTTGLYQFREEAQQIQDKYDNYVSEGREVNTMNARENELADLRKRLEAYAQAYVAKHPEGLSIGKQNQLINVLNMNKKKTLDQAFAESQGEYTDEWDKAENRYMQGDFPTPYGLTQNKQGEISYAQSPQLQQALSQHRYGISSDAAPAIKQLYNSQKYSTPLGNMTMKEYHDAVYSQLQEEWDKSKPNYDRITKIQEAYLEEISKNVIQPILNTYGSSVLSAGKSSDIMQEFGKMLYSMIPSNEYRIDKRGRQIYKSTPYMTVDIPKWLNKNFGAYRKSTNTTNRRVSDRLSSIRSSINQGHKSTAKAKARALIQDIGNGKASVSRDELEWLQGVLND